MRHLTIFLLGYLYLPLASLAFENTVFIKVDSSMRSPTAKPGLRVAYNIYSPFSKFVAYDVPTKAGDKVFRLSLPVMDFQLNGKRVLAQPYDTIYLVKNAEGQLEPDQISNYSSGYLQACKIELYAVREYPTAYLGTHTISESDYYQYCKSYFDKEVALVEQHIPAEKREIASFLKARATYSFVYNYLYYSTLNTLDKEAAFTRIKDNLQFTLAGLPNVVDYSYRTGLAAIAEFQANGVLASRPDASQMMHLVASAEQQYDRKIAKEILLAAMEKCNRIGEASYIPVLDSIYRILQTMVINAEELAMLEEQYRKGKLLSINLSFFKQLKLFSANELEGDSGSFVVKWSDKKLFLLDLWASWCGPCIEEAPALLKLQNKFDSLQIISISIDKDAGKWQQAMKKYGSSVLDNYRTSQDALDWFSAMMGEVAVPRYLLYDRSGKCISVNAPRPTDPALERLISNLMQN